jgi:hypothetical protein
VFDKAEMKGFEIEFHSHAKAILAKDFVEAVTELDSALDTISIAIEDLVRGGGGEAKVTQSLRRKLSSLGWQKHKFEIKKLIDGKERASVSHQIDHVRMLPGGMIALEIEWNNKDPFFDRDLENFKRLHTEGAISVGVIITRGSSLQQRIKPTILSFAQRHGFESFEDLKRFEVTPTTRQRREVERRMKSGEPFHSAWADMLCSDKYGQATTHWRKLQDRINRGVGNPCPLLLIGIPATVVVG